MDACLTRRGRSGEGTRSSGQPAAARTGAGVRTATWVTPAGMPLERSKRGVSIAGVCRAQRRIELMRGVAGSREPRGTCGSDRADAPREHVHGSGCPGFETQSGPDDLPGTIHAGVEAPRSVGQPGDQSQSTARLDVFECRAHDRDLVTAVMNRDVQNAGRALQI